MGLIIYLACDDEAKSKLRAEETENRFSLEGKDEDPKNNCIHQTYNQHYFTRNFAGKTPTNSFNAQQYS